MPDFLLELLSEEIPARMQRQAAADLERLFTAEIASAGVAVSSIETFVTPRRLALIARGLPAETAAASEELKGPRTSAPPQALEGFLRKTGLAQNQLEDRDGIWFAVIDKPGRKTADVLASAILEVVANMPWPKSMRWGVNSVNMDTLRWIRPLQGIVALFGGEVVPVEIGSVASGRTTRGHRFMSEGEIEIAGADDYAPRLRAAHVIVSSDERAAIIFERARKAATDAGLELIDDEGLTIENAGLTEWPVPLLGHFDPAFLDVPPEVVQLTMRTNQKYFALRDASGQLAPAFICTANIEASDGGKAIALGNQKVLAARLSDARFFWEQDKQKSLAQHAEKLGEIVFHEKLGTVADKVERVAKLARWLVEEGIVGSTSACPEPVEGPPGKGLRQAQPRREKRELADLAEKAARLAKADLTTGMVGEFPELQGIMGGHYARAEGLPPEVADAVRDHYKPVGQGDEVPTAPVTVAVSLADKLDTLTGFFAINEKPSGSRDPFALRRAAISIISLVLENNVRAGMPDMLGQSLQLHGVYWWERLMRAARGADAQMRTRTQSFLEMAENATGRPTRYEATSLEGVLTERLTSADEVQKAAFAFADMKQLEIVPFLGERLKVQQREAGVRHDLIDAVFALGGEDDLVRLLARVKALQGFVGTPVGNDLLSAYRRAANILQIEEKRDGRAYRKEVRQDLLKREEEVELYQALKRSADYFETAISDEDFEGAMTVLAGLRSQVDAFFDGVTVNAEEGELRENRLNLLSMLRQTMHKVADFSRIEG